MYALLLCLFTFLQLYGCGFIIFLFVIVDCSLLFLYNDLMCKYVTVYLSIFYYWWILWVVSSLGLTNSNAVNIPVCNIYEHMHAFLLDKYLWIEWLSHRVGIGLAVVVTEEQFSIVTVSIYIPACSVCVSCCFTSLGHSI